MRGEHGRFLHFNSNISVNSIENLYKSVEHILKVFTSKNNSFCHNNTLFTPPHVLNGNFVECDHILTFMYTNLDCLTK